MLSYKDFKDTVKKLLPCYLTNTYRNYKIASVDEDTGMIEGIVFSPAICFNEMYDEYKKLNDINILLKKKAKDIQSYINNAGIKEMQGNKESNILLGNIDVNKIICKLVSSTQYKNILSEIPYKKFIDDMIIIYEYIIVKNNTEIISTVIYNRDIMNCGFSADELYTLAIQNTANLFPASCIPMAEYYASIFMSQALDFTVKEAQTFFELYDKLKLMPAYILSNSEKYNGATAALYKDTLQNIAVKLNSSFYYFFSSIHEVLIIGQSMGIEKLKEIINKTKKGIINGVPEEYLSSCIYYYDINAKKSFLLQT